MNRKLLAVIRQKQWGITNSGRLHVMIRDPIDEHAACGRAGGWPLPSCPPPKTLGLADICPYCLPLLEKEATA